MKSCHVDRYIVSSTTTCTDDYLRAFAEILDLIALDQSKVIPCLWLTESGLSDEVLMYARCSGINWGCLKIHPALRPCEWKENGETIHRLCELSRVMGNLPILIHTGNDESCRARKYEKIIEQNPDLSFILAHARPLEEAVYMAQTYTNVFVDTAFLPVKDIVKFVQLGLTASVLWGSDYCIPAVYDEKIILKDYYQAKLKNLRKSIDSKAFLAITSDNANTLFSN